MIPKIQLEVNRKTFWRLTEVVRYDEQTTGGRAKTVLASARRNEIEVTPDWVFVYETAGGHDCPVRGKLLNKINIADCEFEEIETES